MKKVKKFLSLAIAAGMCFGLFAKESPQLLSLKQQITVEKVPGISDDILSGVDISSLADIEKAGGVYYGTDGKEADLFDLLKENGVNCVRLRVWNNPTYAEDVKDAEGKVIAKKGQPIGGGNNSVETDLDLAVRAKKAGMKLLIDFHYSDSWADPGKQNISQDWAKYDEDKLNEAVEKFTKDSIKKFIKAGARPDMVQIGNELNNGFMWPIGKIWAIGDEKVGGMDSFIRLLKSASAGVRDAQGKGDKIKIVVHLANGGNNDLYRSIFDPIKEARLDYDVIGLSFYTYWHGTFDELKANMDDLSKRYGKELAVVETAYGFTSEDGDDQGNVFMLYSDDAHGYRASVQGQATAIRDCIATVASVKGGIGVFYWEPAWIPVKGAGLSTTEGDTWENQAMFDFRGRALPSLAVWNLVKGKGEYKNVWGGTATNTTPGYKKQIYALADTIKVDTTPGKAPELPSKIKVVYDDDSEGLVAVKWEKHDWSSEKNLGIKTISGTIDGTDFIPKADVEITNALNLIPDSSWESGKLGIWKLNGSSTACFVENNKSNARTGKWTYKYWLATGFKSILSTNMTNLKDGTYKLSVWAMGGGGENSIRLFVSDFDGTKNQKSTKIVNTGWRNWKQYTVEFNVVGGKATLGIYLDTNAGNWGNFDDVELVRIGD